MYEGFFENGKRQGAGRIIYQDGSHIQGTFMDNEACGQCLYISADKSTMHSSIFDLGSAYTPDYKGEPLTEEIRQDILQKRESLNQVHKNGDQIERMKNNLREQVMESFYEKYHDYTQNALEFREANDL